VLGYLAPQSVRLEGNHLQREGRVHIIFLRFLKQCITFNQVEIQAYQTYFQDTSTCYLFLYIHRLSCKDISGYSGRDGKVTSINEAANPYLFSVLGGLIEIAMQEGICVGLEGEIAAYLF